MLVERHPIDTDEALRPGSGPLANDGGREALDPGDAESVERVRREAQRGADVWLGSDPQCEADGCRQAAEFAAGVTLGQFLQACPVDNVHASVVFVENKLFIAGSTGPTAHITPAFLLQAFWWAYLSFDGPMLDALAGFDLEEARQAQGGAVDEFQLAWAAAVQQYWRPEGESAERTRLAMSFADESAELSREEADLLWLPAMRVGLAMWEAPPGEDPNAVFNQRLAEALAAHRRYWGTEERRNDPRGFVSWPLTALASIWHTLGDALERDCSVDVRSDYLPMWLYQGGLAQHGREAEDDQLEDGLVRQLEPIAYLKHLVPRHPVETAEAEARAAALLAPQEDWGLDWFEQALRWTGEIVGEISDLATELAELRLACDHRGERRQTRLAARFALQNAVAVFKSASTRAVEDGEADWAAAEAVWGSMTYEPLEERGQSHEGLHALGPWRRADATGWLHAFWLATIGLHFTVHPLAEYPVDDLRLAGGQPCDEFLYSWIKTLRALLGGDTALAAEHLQSALALAHAKGAERTGQDEVELLWLPQFAVAAELIAALGGEADRHVSFNLSLARALEAHRAFWTSSAERSATSRGFVSWPLLGLACWAADRDVPVYQESEYLPEFLLDERFWLSDLGWADSA